MLKIASNILESMHNPYKVLKLGGFIYLDVKQLVQHRLFNVACDLHAFVDGKDSGLDLSSPAHSRGTLTYTPSPNHRTSSL